MFANKLQGKGASLQMIAHDTIGSRTSTRGLWAYSSTLAIYLACTFPYHKRKADPLAMAFPFYTTGWTEAE